MTRHTISAMLIVALCATASNADTFKHRQTGEVFHGFLTQKHNQTKTLAYIEKDKSFKPLELSAYEVTRDDKGRRNTVVVIPITTEHALISQNVSNTIAKMIVDASNKGPRYIILEIDSPGGYGLYMKNICATIANTVNCPVIAYITGGTYGGAYSAAVPIALACEKVYIAGDAAMGSLAPAVGTPTVRASQDEYNAVFASDNLGGFRAYVSAIAANRGRPETLAMAFLDKSTEIQEVEDQDGNRRFVKKEDRSPQESIIRTVSKVETRTVSTGDDSGGTREISQVVLTLGADDAVKAGLADKVVIGRNDVLDTLGVADAQITYSRAVEKSVRKFIAARRNVDKSLVQIDFLQQRADALRAQYDNVSEQIRTSPTTREQRYGDGGYDYGYGSTRARRYDRYNRGYGSRYGSRYGRGSSRRLYGGRRSEYVTGVEPPAGAYALAEEFTATVSNLVREYRRVLGLAKRDPGTLPVGVTINDLQRRHDETVALQNGLMASFR